MIVRTYTECRTLWERMQVQWWCLLTQEAIRSRDSHFTNLSLWSQDQARVWKSDYHSSETVKLRRKRRRQERKGFEDTQKEIEGETYSSRDFWVYTYSVILHYSNCYCVLLHTCFFLLFSFSFLLIESTWEFDSVCNYYVVQLQTSALLVFLKLLSLHTVHYI